MQEYTATLSQFWWYNCLVDMTYKPAYAQVLQMKACVTMELQTHPYLGSPSPGR